VWVSPVLSGVQFSCAGDTLDPLIWRIVPHKLSRSFFLSLLDRVLYLPGRVLYFLIVNKLLPLSLPPPLSPSLC